MKIAIIGAGITGLSAGQLLSDKHEVVVLEQKNVCGGIARTKDVNGVAYHIVGGHCFNSKYNDVLDFVFNRILQKNEWHLIRRKSFILFNGHEIPYPIEFAVKNIYNFDKELAVKIVVDFLQTNDTGKYDNLDDWFRKKFGNTLAEEYFIPYNTKIWNNDLKKMNSIWVEDKLPIPDKHSFVENLLSKVEDNMSHASFYYPNSNNQNTFIDALAKKLSLKYNYEVQSIKYDSDNKKCIINGNLSVDKIINTSPIDVFPSFIENVPDNVLDAAKKLKYNSISNVLWKTQPTEKTWTYFPKDGLFHRHIHIGAYHIPIQGYSVSEVVGKHSFEEMKQNYKQDGFLIEPLDYNISEHAYVVFDNNYMEAKNTVINYLNSIKIDTIGRFGEWQYYNMDMCIKRSIDLAKKINQEN